MKKIKLLLALLLGLTTATMAQMKPQLTAVIKTPTVQCQECKERIEKYMSHEDGVLKINVDYKKKTTTVTYLIRPHQHREYKDRHCQCRL